MQTYRLVEEQKRLIEELEAQVADMRVIKVCVSQLLSHSRDSHGNVSAGRGRGVGVHGWLWLLMHWGGRKEPPWARRASLADRRLGLSGPGLGPALALPARVSRARMTDLPYRCLAGAL